MTLTFDREQWAETLKVEEIHGDASPAHVAERIGAPAEVGDLESIERWRQIHCPA